MDVLINIQDWRSLTEAVNKVKPFEGFFTKNLFKNKQSVVGDAIDWYVIEAVDKISKFVKEEDSSLNVGKTKRYIKSLKLPRIFEHKIFSAIELAKFKGNTDGNLYVNSPADRVKQANMMILQELDDLKTRIFRRTEQMAAAAASTGAISVTQDNVAFSYDFEFEVNKHLVTLGSTKKWNVDGINPLSDIRKWKKQITKATGLKPDMLILGSEVADVFVSHPAVMDALHNNNYKAGQIDLTQDFGLGATPIGTLLGLKVFEYDQDYTDEAGSVASMFDPKRVLLVASSSPDFRLYHGPIHRIEGENLKTYSVDELVEPTTTLEKTALKWSVESKPLPVVHEPNALVSAIVI